MVVSWLCKNGWPITLESRCKLFPEHRLEISTTAGRDCNRAGLLSLSDLCQWTSHLWYQQVVNICCFLKLCMAEGRFQVSWTKMHRLITMLLSTCEVEALARLQRPRTLEPQCLNIPWHNFIGMCVLRTLFLLSILYIKKEAPQKEDGHHRAVALNSRIWHVAYRERCDNGKNVGFIKKQNVEKF